MPKPTTAYILVNAKGTMRSLITNELGLHLEHIRRQRGWAAAKCVWWEDFDSLADAKRWTGEFRRASVPKRRAWVEDKNPRWADISGLPNAVVAGATSMYAHYQSVQAQARAKSELGLLGAQLHDRLGERTAEVLALRAKIHAIRQKLWDLGLDPNEYDDWGEDPGEGGVGAIRHGWPDFPGPRRGADALSLPRPED